MLLRLLIKIPYYLSLISAVAIVLFHIQDGGSSLLVHTIVWAKLYGVLATPVGLILQLWPVVVWLLFAGLHRWVLKQ